MLTQSLIVLNIFSQILLPGSHVDNHNCALDGGYTWCESYRNCIRMWGHPCPDNYNDCDDCLSKQRDGINIACPEGCDTIVVDPMPPIAVDPMPCPMLCA